MISEFGLKIKVITHLFLKILSPKLLAKIIIIFLTVELGSLSFDQNIPPLSTSDINNNLKWMVQSFCNLKRGLKQIVDFVSGRS